MNGDRRTEVVRRLATLREAIAEARGRLYAARQRLSAAELALRVSEGMEEESDLVRALRAMRDQARGEAEAEALEVVKMAGALERIRAAVEKARARQKGA